MSIVAAKCPCCGRDIGFEENTAEYTCIFCGARLRTSALRSEVLSGGNASSPRPAAETEARPHTHSQEKPREQSGESSERAEREQESLSEEETALQLKRKAEFKEELKKIVKQIDDMRSRKHKLQAKLKTAKGLISGGMGAAVIGIFLLVLFINEHSTFGIIASIVIFMIGGFTLVYSSLRGRETKEELKTLEKSIGEKKEKRDVLIGRLNKINKRLNITHGE